MWLSLYILVPFEYFRYLHRFAFICQDYLLLLTVFILLFLIELPNSISSWQRIQDITNRLSTLLDWQSLEVDLYHTLSSLRSKMTLDGSHRISHSILPEFTTRYTCMIQLSYDPPLLKRQLTYASHFIPSLVYSNDKKPADVFSHNCSLHQCQFVYLNLTGMKRCLLYLIDYGRYTLSSLGIWYHSAIANSQYIGNYNTVNLSGKFRVRSS